MDVEQGYGGSAASPQRADDRKIFGFSREKVLIGSIIGLALLAFILTLIILSSSSSGPTAPAICVNQSTSAPFPSGTPSPSVATPSPGSAASGTTFASLLTNETEAALRREQLRVGVNSTKIGELIKEYSRLPHIAGSARNTELAEMTAQYLRDWGFDDVRLEKMPVLPLPMK